MKASEFKPDGYYTICNDGCIEVNGMAIKDYNSFLPAYKFFQSKSRNKNNVVNLYELKSHAFQGIPCTDDNYLLLESNSINN